MADLALRPLSLGEILDRTFSLYRRHFLLFIGITAVPQIAVLAVNLLNTAMTVGEDPPGLLVKGAILISVFLVGLAGYVFAQGGSIIAVSEIYLGRTITIGEALGRVWSKFGPLLGVLLLSGLAIFGAMLLLIVPGIYVMCRLLVCVPAALIEQRGARNAMSRSFALTKDFAGRAFLIVLLGLAIGIAAGLLFTAPFSVAILMASSDPGRLRFWTEMSEIGSSVGSILVAPITLIASSIFYYDLRVRKEAFDIQIMMNPGSEASGGGSTGPVSILS